LRGRRVSVIYQDSSVLNPVLRIGTQLTEILRAHENWSRQECRDRAIALLEAVEFRDADRIFAAFPHQLSGGQRQRVVIAQALAGRPSLIIADEPTSSLDGAVTAEILELLVGLKRRFHTSFLLISHDVGVLEVLADEIMVMYCGRIVEQGSRRDILQRALHPYTRALLACTLPGDNDLTPGSHRRPAPMIPASFGPMRTWRGCDFECRCPDRMAVCAERVPDQLEVSAARTVRCFKFVG
jgi:peptide/nickel transport system ATP-binding protein